MSDERQIDPRRYKVGFVEGLVVLSVVVLTLAALYWAFAGLSDMKIGPAG